MHNLETLTGQGLNKVLFFVWATQDVVSYPCSLLEAVLGLGSVCERGRGIPSPVHRQPCCKRPDPAHVSWARSCEVQWLCAGSPQLSETDVPSVPFGAWFQMSGDHRRHLRSPLFGGWKGGSRQCDLLAHRTPAAAARPPVPRSRGAPPVCPPTARPLGTRPASSVLGLWAQRRHELRLGQQLARWPKLLALLHIPCFIGIPVV